MTPNPQADDWRALTQAGAALLRQGRPQEALQRLQRAERLAPRERDVRYWLANACRAAGQIDRARRTLRDLLHERPGDLDASFAMAFLLRDAGAPGEAAEVLLQASRQAGVTAHQLLQIGGFLRDANQIGGAIEVCEKAVAVLPREADMHFKLARLYQAAGAFDKSLASLRRTLELNPAAGPAWIALAQQKKFDSAGDPEFRRLSEAAGRSLDREADLCIAFAYGKALDDLGRWPEAWVQYRRGNELISRSLVWNRRAWADFVEHAAARGPALKTLDSEGTSRSGRNAVYIVGMPRSGTTLLEQILDRHPRITGRGELNQLAYFASQRTKLGPPGSAQRSHVADVLWTQLRLEGQEAAHYIDKNPLNFRYLDLLFEIFPGARVLHVTRDGRASCLSCYFQLFEHTDTAFSCSLEDLVQFYAGYRRLMAHWERVWPDRILRVEYNDLVNNVRDTVARALAFLGVGWDDAVLQKPGRERVVRGASAWQARQPVHQRSIERWRHYYDQAPDFFDRLAAIDAA